MHLGHFAKFLFAIIAPLLVGAAEAADVKQLVAALSSGPAAERRTAADALADMGYAAQESAPQLIAALGSEDAELRWRAARALGLIGNPQAVPALRKLASDAEPLARAQAIYALGRLRAADEESLKSIIGNLTEKDVQVRRAAVRAMSMIKADRKVTMPLVLKLLEDSDHHVAMRALSAIAEAGAEAVPALNAALANPQGRYWACIALSEMGAAAKDAVPGLRNALADERPQVRLQATIALAEIGAASRPALPELIKTLSDPFESVRDSAVFALGRIADKAAADAVAKADKPGEPYMHMLSTWALARMHPDDKARQQAAIELLASHLGNKDRDMAHTAARGIAELEPAPDVIRPVMAKIIEGADAETADRIFNALASLGARIVPLAINALKDQAATRRERAMRVLAKIGPEAAPAVPELINIIQTRDAKEKMEALFVVGAVGPGASAATKAAVSALANNDPQVKHAAGYALGKIGAGASEAVPALKQLSASDDEFLRMVSIWALLQIGPRNDDLVKSALPILTRALGSEREIVRVEAAMSLGALGKAAASALPALEKATQDAQSSVRSAASEAISKIKG